MIGGLIILLVFTYAYFRGKRDYLVKLGEVKKSSLKKYAFPLREAPNTIYYKIFKLKYREKFPLSATVLVFLSDKWHFYRFIMNHILVFVLVFLLQFTYNWLEYLIFYAILFTGFSSGYYLNTKTNK